MKLVWCPPGTFTMGTPGATNEEAPVRVMLTSGFRLGQTVVTQAQWNAVMGWRSKPWSGMDYVKDGPNFPATYVSHGTVKADSATAYCEKLTQIERQAGRLPTGWKCVLPTEAQWEYACRAGTTTPYNFKGDELQLGASAWFDKNASDIGERYAHAVGTKLANPWGLSDMHGNVWELCHDRYVDKLPGGRDPAGPSNGSDRVSRGGSWDGSAGRCRSACRRGDGPSRRNFNLGFRICLSSD